MVYKRERLCARKKDHGCWSKMTVGVVRATKSWQCKRGRVGVRDVIRENKGG